MKIHYSFGIGFGPRFCTHTVGVNDYFLPIRKNLPPPKPNVLGNKNIIWPITGKVTVVQKTW